MATKKAYIIMRKDTGDIVQSVAHNLSKPNILINW